MASTKNLQNLTGQIADLNGRSVIEYEYLPSSLEEIIRNLIDQSFFVAVIEEQSITSPDELFVTMTRTCNFPWYFGFNWDALKDCLLDFHWLKEPAHGYLIIFRNPLNLNDSDLKTLTEIIADVSKIWASENIPFKLLLPKL